MVYANIIYDYTTFCLYMPGSLNSMISVLIMSTRLILALLACSGLVSANFTADFSAFLEETYGSAIREQLERLDLADYGSFGGKVNRNDTLAQQPLIIVHGVSDTAGEKPLWAAAWFRENSTYKMNEIYATTYWNGAEGNALKWLQYTMKCEYVKQVRNLIIAVNAYTGMKVDVLAYSLGVPISRKAILGGSCVDASENLGATLTDKIDTFVGVAGPNQGASMCSGFSLFSICGTTIGLYPGCSTPSSFLQDINSSSGYEGSFVYSVYSQSDSMVGYQVCSKKTSQIPGQTGEKEYTNLSHDDVFTETHDVQVGMFRDHIVA